MPKIRPTIASELRRVAESETATRLESERATRSAARVAENERVPYTREQLAGATHVRFSWGLARVVRVNASTVTVNTGQSWDDRYPIAKVLEFYPFPEATDV